MTDIIVTDHAMLRFIERFMGVDVEELARMIRQNVHLAVEAGASSATIGGACFTFLDNGNGRVVVTTVLPPGGRSHGQDHRRRFADRVRPGVR